MQGCYGSCTGVVKAVIPSYWRECLVAVRAGGIGSVPPTGGGAGTRPIQGPTPHEGLGGAPFQTRWNPVRLKGFPSGATSDA
jgi:hypothetical protein